MLKFKHILVVLFLLWKSSASLFAQTDFYDVDSIQEIKLYFAEPNWDAILDSIFLVDEENRWVADLTIDGVPFSGVGVRYKGFSSFSTNRNKNPFNIDLNYTVDGQDYQGVTKIKLSNVIQDPSFVREVLSYEIARKYMPASRANYANVYVNDTLIGLYTNVEDVGNDFLQTYFGTESNAFFKCNPENLELNGENSNLSDSPGANVEDYYPLYALKSDNESDYLDLKTLIDTLNQAPNSVDKYLNIDRTLWMHAFNYALINFDSYVGYAQNYYLYKDQSGRFNPILWDLNMSFASFRLSDASDNWDGFSVQEAKTIDPLGHHFSVSVKPRPLMRNLFQNDQYRRMYLAHIRTIVEENFLNQSYSVRAQALQNKIASSVANDTNKFYSTSDFTDNLHNTVSDLVDYPGITDLIDARALYLSNYTGFQGAPDISNVSLFPTNTVAGDDIFIKAQVSQLTAQVYLAYRFAENEAFMMVQMLDNGLNNDGLSGDGIFGAPVQNIANVMQYYIYAENDTAGRFSPERAAYAFYTLESKLAFGDLAINEVMADNAATVVDNFNQADDWIELYNASAYSISTSGLYLTDEKDIPNKWSLPAKVIAPGEYLMIWADDDASQGSNHASFQLNNAGDRFWLTYADSTVVDSVIFGRQYSYSTFGRYPNGTGAFQELQPSYNRSNEDANSAVFTDPVFLFPNPSAGEVNLRFNTETLAQIRVFSMDGREVISDFDHQGAGQIVLDFSSFSAGVYLLKCDFGDSEIQKKIIIRK